MALANVNLGSGPSAGDGSPLRTAFGIINNNFAQLQSNVTSLTNSVTTVAGRTGNVVLTVNDIVGLNGLYPNNSTISTWISANIAALVGTAPTILDTLGEIADAINDDANVYTTLVNSITSANLAMKGYVDFANTVQAGAILAANLGVIGYVDSAVTTANTGVVGYVDNAVTTANTGVVGYVDSAVITANLGMKGYVDSQSHYSNINLKSYLSVVDMTVTPTANLTYNLGSPTNKWNNVYAGNTVVTNVQFPDQSEQYTAWTGSETRTVFTSNVRYKPTWLSYYPGGDKNTYGSSFGFDYSIGMFFAGNADYPAYPIRMNTPFHEDDRIEVTATIDFDDQGDDNSIAIFLANVEPQYSFTANNTRISWNSNFGTPAIYGLTGVNTAVAPVLTAGNWYTIKFVYDRNANAAVTVYTYSGNAAVGTPIDTRSLNERLPHGIYTVGFDGDNDQIGNNSKFANLTVKTINDTVARNLEVTGSILSGNIIPQANVAYSLGNVTHQWKDLYLSGNTMYIGGATLSVSGGVINTSLPIAGNIETSNLTITGTTVSFSNGAYIDETEIVGLPGYYGLALNSSDDGIVGINALDSSANIATSVIATNVSVQINTNDSSNVLLSHTWIFQDGDLTTPGNVQISGGNLNVLSVQTEFGVISIGNQQDGTFVVTDPYFDPSIYVAGQAFYVTTNGNGASSYQFTFGQYGTSDVVFPGNLSLGDGVDSEIINPGNNIFITADSVSWTFGTDGNLTFPDSTTQTTAWNESANAAIIGYVGSAVTTANVGMKGYVDDAVSNIPDSYTDANVNTLLASWGSNTLSTTGNVAVGGILTDNYYYANGTPFIGGGGGSGTNYTDANVVSLLSSFGSNSITTTGDVTAANFIGNVSLTGNVTGTNANVTLVAGAYEWEFDNTGNTTMANGTVSATTVNAVDLTLTGNISATVDGYDIGYKIIPQVSAGNVTLALTDSGKHYYSTSTAPLTLTVPSNANVAFPVGTAITIVNKGTANLTVALEAEASMYLVGNATSASRTITSYGMATVMKTATDEWFINGTGIN